MAGAAASAAASARSIRRGIGVSVDLLPPPSPSPGPDRMRWDGRKDARLLIPLELTTRLSSPPSGDGEARRDGNLGFGWRVGGRLDLGLGSFFSPSVFLNRVLVSVPGAPGSFQTRLTA